MASGLGPEEWAGCPLGAQGTSPGIGSQDNMGCGSAARPHPCVEPASAILLCGILAGGSQSQRPRCVQCPGLCGRLNKGSIRVGPPPPPSAAGLLACRKSCWQPTKLPAHAHPERQADKEGGREAGDEQQVACGLRELLTQGGLRLLQQQVTGGKMVFPAFLRPPHIPGPPHLWLLPTTLQQRLVPWPPLLTDGSGLPPSSTAASSLPPMFLRACPGRFFHTLCVLPPL